MNVYLQTEPIKRTDGRAELLLQADRIVKYRRLSWSRKLVSHPMTTVYNSIAMRALRLLFSWGISLHKDTVTFFGEHMTVLLPTGYNEIYLHGAAVDVDAEVRLTKFLLRHLGEGSIFFDVGACLGYYSLLGLRLVGGGGHVHAFEPSAPLISLLRRNLNGKPNALVIDKALSDVPGSTEFFVAPLPFIGTSSLRHDWQERKTNIITVETIRLDDYCYSNRVFPDMIKLDVEGVEDRVLKGAERLLREKPPLIVMEVFTPLIESDRQAIQRLKELDYVPCAIQEDGKLQALGYRGIEPYLADIKTRYRVIQDSINDFDNLVFKQRSSSVKILV